MLYPVRIARTYPITQGSACRNSCKVSPGSSCRNNENPGGGQLPGIGGQSKMEWGVKGCRNSYHCNRGEEGTSTEYPVWHRRVYGARCIALLDERASLRAWPGSLA